MTALEYEHFIDRVAQASAACKYGHYACSDVEGGRCAHEEWSKLSEEDREDLL